LQWLSILFCFGYEVWGLDRIFLGYRLGVGEMTGETATARAKAKTDPYGMTNRKGNDNGKEDKGKTGSRLSANTPSFAVKPAKDGAPVLLAGWSFGLRRMCLFFGGGRCYF
jgi:hypothetical protein